MRNLSALDERFNSERGRLDSNGGELESREREQTPGKRRMHSVETAYGFVMDFILSEGEALRVETERGRNSQRSYGAD